METLVVPLRPRPAPTLGQKVAFLSDPASYPPPARPVRAVQTHMSWVFLTGDRAYKLKKPLRLDHHDLASVAARREHCRTELRLNRRLTDDVYLGTLPLGLDETGALRLGGGLRTVDWLVVMRRLPASLMLDRLLERGTVGAERLDAFVQRLVAFYREAPPEPLTGADLRARLAAHIAENVRQLCRFSPPLRAAAIDALGERQLAWMEARGALLDRRAADGLVVEGHGDLRPEHICLEAVPQVIDCLEFSRELRVVDRAEELAFLALECERLGDAGVGAAILERYERLTGDRPPPPLTHFYQSCHALNRARLAILHLDDGERHAAKWMRRTRQYIRLAAQHLDRG